MQEKTPKPALLALADGTLFHGASLSLPGYYCGEVVFNTAMSGYQEIFTDPSYANQIVVLTTAHVGNTGINRQDLESDKCWLAGLAVKEASNTCSSWLAEENMHPFLAKHRIPCLYGIDTRQLALHLREKGAQNGCIAIGNCAANTALQRAREHPSSMGLNLISRVSTPVPYAWQKGSYSWLGKGLEKPKRAFSVYVYDFGVKYSILRKLVDLGCRVDVVGAACPYAEILAAKPDGVVLSNGPGDPSMAFEAIDSVRAFLQHKVPLLGICFGCQLLGLACGGSTQKMKFGHHGINHPVLDIRRQRVLVTSQNHGFAIDPTSLPANLEVTHRSLCDHSIEGIRCLDAPAIGFQGHPEGGPGPLDVHGIFNEFIQLMRGVRA